jgi:Alkylmercury lyase
MLLFRSEQHVDHWCEQWNRPRGGILDLQQGWRLAKEWYGDRLSPAWQPKSASEAQAAFGRIGLKGEFWKMSV